MLHQNTPFALLTPELFQNYLDAKKLAVRDVLKTCITKMMDGTYTCPGQRVAHLQFWPQAVTGVLPLSNEWSAAVMVSPCVFIQRSWFHHVCSYSGHGFTMCVHTPFKLEGKWRCLIANPGWESWKNCIFAWHQPLSPVGSLGGDESFTFDPAVFLILTLTAPYSPRCFTVTNSIHMGYI